MSVEALFSQFLHMSIDEWYYPCLCISADTLCSQFLDMFIGVWYYFLYMSVEALYSALALVHRCMILLVSAHVHKGIMLFSVQVSRGMILAVSTLVGAWYCPFVHVCKGIILSVSIHVCRCMVLLVPVLACRGMVFSFSEHICRTMIVSVFMHVCGVMIL